MLDWFKLATQPQRIALAVGGALFLVLAIFALLYAITDKIQDGGVALGREQAGKEQVENVDKELQARFTVRDCLRSGRMWLDAERRCVDPVPAPRK